MCRIAGIYNPSLEKTKLRAFVQGMCDDLKHGGPDDSGIFSDVESSLVLGHRRLSIIDLSPSGHQPMVYGDGRWVITYNGELYNYKELKLELSQLGAIFNSQSDTEVIVAAYAKWGLAAFEKFNGMFAFAIWDQKQKEIVLVRDSSGIKPLYFAQTKEGLAFASEVGAFKNIDYLQEPNPKWPVYFLAYGHLPEPITTFKNIQPLEKGVYLIYKTADQSIISKPFNSFRLLEKIENRKEAVDLVKTKLNNAVKKQLISDAPLGVFLSGGLDSSIIATIANSYQKNINTVSIYFENRNYSEKIYQDILLKKLGCENHQFLIQEKDFHEFLPNIIQSMDLPCCDGINTWFISKYAKESGLKTVLSGIGGDELFGGYPSFKRIKVIKMLEKLPEKILKAGRFSDSKKLRRLCYLSIGGAIGKYLFLRGQFIPTEISSILSIDEHEVWSILAEAPKLPEIDYLSPLNQASWLETNLYLQNQLLRDADTMSMANGLEIRVPFLDEEFVRTVLMIKSDIKYEGKHGKQLLIDAFKSELPEPVWNRPKMGFSFPFKEWLSSEEYAQVMIGKTMRNLHGELKKDQLHWSQFFSLMLMQKFFNA